MRVFRFLSLFVILMLLIASPVYAFELSIVKQAFDGSDIRAVASMGDIGSFSVKESLSFDKAILPLYPTFDSPELALEYIKGNKAVKVIQTTFRLAELSSVNWKDYASRMLTVLDFSDKPEWYREGNESFEQMRSFFDIYENEEKNTEVEKIVKKIDSSSLDYTEELEELIFAMPYHSARELKTKLDSMGIKHETANNLSLNIIAEIVFGTIVCIMLCWISSNTRKWNH
ncbi:hypothetical protein KPC83_05930 [Collinsella sp. zg1085]|uniref:hypothetical protein n=1 Tax=Collinsella sp. zg1085 TaxID=2844380 RepID=UPI001C0E1A37|nr:hypothetical protein [Collinsella sp. zg1085]QWT17376.1 hypothetical protein KPC83_05930 [Collinsella sp. zg1085]